MRSILRSKICFINLLRYLFFSYIEYNHLKRLKILGLQACSPCWGFKLQQGLVGVADPDSI